MNKTLRLAYTLSEKAIGDSGLLPFLPLTLFVGDQKVNAAGLLDTGSTVNVLPFSVGQSLGMEWEKETTRVPLTGNLATVESVGVFVSAQVEDLAPVNLVFAWAKTDDIPMILGQTNFFLEFNVCFFRSQMLFEIRRKE